jgi:hypothetical protein
MLDKQTTFNQAVAHLRKQNRPSVNAKGVCAYRGVGGLKCPVGFLISDSLYDPSFENHKSVYWEIQNALIQSGHDPVLARELQVVHDHYQVCEWEEEFKDIADEFRLVYTPPDVAITQ